MHSPSMRFQERYTLVKVKSYGRDVLGYREALELNSNIERNYEAAYCRFPAFGGAEILWRSSPLS